MLIPEALRPSAIAAWRVRRWSGGVIQGGPFTGMRYPATECGSALLPKLLGTYEREIASIFEEIRMLQPSMLIDVGAAEGYYAVGCLYAGLVPKVVAFELESRAQAVMQRLRELNHIPSDRLEVRGFCSRVELAPYLETPRVVLVIDVEGHELLLLDPLRLPALARAHILVETHDFIIHGTTDELIERMTNSHAITIINAAARTFSDLECDDFIFQLLPAHRRLAALSEYRPSGMKWLWMRPKDRS